jgi:hypothetical protein
VNLDSGKICQSIVCLWETSPHKHHIEWTSTQDEIKIKIKQLQCHHDTYWNNMCITNIEGFVEMKNWFNLTSKTEHKDKNITWCKSKFWSGMYNNAFDQLNLKMTRYMSNIHSTINTNIKALYHHQQHEHE